MNILQHYFSAILLQYNGFGFCGQLLLEPLQIYRLTDLLKLTYFCDVITGSPFKACVINPDRVAPCGGWLSLFNGNSVVRSYVNTLQLVEFETCQAGNGIRQYTLLLCIVFCRGYKNLRPYPYAYPQILRGYPWIYP